MNFKYILALLFLVSCKQKNGLKHNVFPNVVSKEYIELKQEQVLINKINLPKKLKEEINSKERYTILKLSSINYNFDFYIIMFEKSDYLIIAYNKQTNKFSDIPLELNPSEYNHDERGYNSKLILLKEPFYYLYDIKSNNRYSFVIKSRVHNGNTYNAVIENFYDIDSISENIHKYLSFESISYFPFERVYIIRYINKDIVKVYAGENMQDSSHLVGLYNYRIDSCKLKPYNIHIFDSLFENLMITCSP